VPLEPEAPLNASLRDCQPVLRGRGSETYGVDVKKSEIFSYEKDPNDYKQDASCDMNSLNITTKDLRKLEKRIQCDGA
jgi:hypothetical protein